MSRRVFRTTTAVALVVSLGLVCLPACKKSKPTEADSPAPNPGPVLPAPGPAPNATGGRDPSAPRSPVFATTTEAPFRAAAKNDLMQIGLALHNYHDSMGSLPTGFADKSGKPGLSWRVAILPYIEQGGLYKQFKLDEPWDSPNNQALIKKMPKQFAPPRQDTNGYTFYRGFSGPNTWLPPQSGPRPTGVKFAQITDGLSNTILVAEAYDPVIWTKPDEMEFAPNKVPQLGGVFGTGAHVLMGDGSVRFLRKGFDPKALANAIQINDGNVVDLDN